MCPAAATILGDVLISAHGTIILTIFVAPCELLRIGFLWQLNMAARMIPTPSDAQGLLLVLAQQLCLVRWPCRRTQTSLAIVTSFMAVHQVVSLWCSEILRHSPIATIFNSKRAETNTDIAH